MSLESWQYPLYWPQYITGYEPIRMTIMSQTSMTETEQRIKTRYAFALSSFGRSFRPNGITFEMRRLCRLWSEGMEEIPSSWPLQKVDSYFLNLWKAHF